MAIKLKLLQILINERLATMFTPGTVVTRYGEEKKGLVLFYDKHSGKYAVKWPKRRRYVSPVDLQEVVFQAKLFEAS